MDGGFTETENGVHQLVGFIVSDYYDLVVSKLVDRRKHFTVQLQNKCPVCQKTKVNSSQTFRGYTALQLYRACWKPKEDLL